MRIRVSSVLPFAALFAIACAAPAGAAPAHTAALSPPVIHESFTVLPCSGSSTHRTTLEQEGCAEHQILKSDKKIDALNKTIFTNLTGDPARRRFIAGHRAWLAYRRAYCLSRSDIFAGGTEAGVIDADCVAGLNAQHIGNLREFVSDLNSE